MRRPAPIRSSRPRAVRDAEQKTAVLPLLSTLLVVGVLCAAGIAWMAPTPEPQDELVALPSKADTRPAETGNAAPGPRPSAPAAEPAFLDPSGAGAFAYAARDYEGALAQYRTAIDRNPDDAESYSNMGQMLVRLKRVEEAIPHFDRAITILPQRWAYHFNRARALGLLERWDEAIAGYQQAQRLFPDDYATAFNLAQTFHRKGDETAAVEQYLRAIELDPSDPTFRMALGISYERLERRPEAAASYSEYLRLAPNAPDAEKVRARIALLAGTAEETRAQDR